MHHGLSQVVENRFALGVELVELVGQTGLYAMRRGEHQVLREKDAGAEIAAAAQDHHLATEIRGVYRGRAADHRCGGQGEY